MCPGVPRPPSRARGRRPQKTVRRAPPTICTGLRGGRPACASAFCRGNTGCWVCLDAVCLPSGRRGPLGLYLGSLCWRSGTASRTRAAVCCCCRTSWRSGCSAFSRLPATTPRPHPAAPLGSQGTAGRAAVSGFCMVSHRSRRH